MIIRRHNLSLAGYDYARLKKALQDEYMAATLVGFTPDTPDVMEIEFSSNEELLSMAERYGLDIEDFVLKKECEA